MAKAVVLGPKFYWFIGLHLFCRDDIDTLYVVSSTVYVVCTRHWPRLPQCTSSWALEIMVNAEFMYHTLKREIYPTIPLGEGTHPFEKQINVFPH